MNTYTETRNVRPTVLFAASLALLAVSQCRHKACRAAAEAMSEIMAETSVEATAVFSWGYSFWTQRGGHPQRRRPHYAVLV